MPPKIVKSMVKKAKPDGGLLDTIEDPVGGSARGHVSRYRDEATKEYNERERNFDSQYNPRLPGSRDKKQQAVSGQTNPKAGVNSISDPMESSEGTIRNLAKASEKKRNADANAKQVGLEGNSVYASAPRKRQPMYAGR